MEENVIGLTNSQYYSEIAEAIRQKNETQNSYKPSEMAAAISEIETGIALEALTKPASAQKIFNGYEAYNEYGEKILGVALPSLSNPATSQQVLSGFEAYDANGNLLSGTAFLTGSVATFTLEASNWNGTTYTVTTNNWRVVDGQTPLMDLPFNSSAVNAQRVVESGITMPIVTTKEQANSDTGTITYTTTIVFSAIKTPPVDVDVSVFNITEIIVE